MTVDPACSLLVIEGVGSSQRSLANVIDAAIARAQQLEAVLRKAEQALPLVPPT